MEFERPIFDLEKQIDELKKLAGDQQFSVDAEIAPLERLDPLTRGSLFHEVQAECMRALQQAERLPETGVVVNDEDVRHVGPGPARIRAPLRVRAAAA